MQTAKLVVQVIAARGAVPINDADVAVSLSAGENEQLIAYDTTDSSGRTTELTLEAPDRELSQSPGSARPFGTYNIVVTYSGYRSAYVRDVQTFGEVTSLQYVEMLPLPIGEMDGVTEYDVNAQNL